MTRSHLLRELAATLSLLFFVAILAVWVRSYFASDGLVLMRRSQGPSRIVYENGHPVQDAGDLHEQQWGLGWSRGQLGFRLDRSINTNTVHYQTGWNWEHTDPEPLLGWLPTDKPVFDMQGNHFEVSRAFGFASIKIITKGSSPGIGGISRMAVIPLWFAALLAGAPAGLWFLRQRRQSIRYNRRLRGLCPACGYDVRATPDRCPECGIPNATFSNP